MTQAEYEVFIEQSVRDYAADKVSAGLVDVETAVEQAWAETRQRLPDGVDTASALLFTAIEGAEQVGVLWIALPAERQQAWIVDVGVEPEHRGKGYGRAIMLAAEHEVRRRGFSEIGLNVFGFNTVARDLYTSLGYEVVAQTMAKKLE